MNSFQQFSGIVNRINQAIDDEAYTQWWVDYLNSYNRYENWLKAHQLKPRPSFALSNEIHLVLLDLEEGS